MKERIAGELPHEIVEESLEGEDYTSGFRFEDEILTVYETRAFPGNNFRGFIPLGVAAGLVILLLIQVNVTGASKQSLEMLAFLRLPLRADDGGRSRLSHQRLPPKRNSGFPRPAAPGRFASER